MLLPLSVSPALASSELVLLLEVLRDNGTITEQQFRQLRAAAARAGGGEGPVSAASTGAVLPRRPADNQVGMQAGTTPPRQPLEPRMSDSRGPATADESENAEVETRGGLSVVSDDGRFEFALGGNIWVDAAVYDDDRTALGDGMLLRRARVSLEGKLHRDWEFQAEYDFAENEAEVKDAFIGYSGFPSLSLRVGHFKEPFSLEEQTSGSDLLFMERALPVEAFSPGRRLGLALSSGGDRWSAAAGVFGEAIGDDPAEEGDSGWGVTGRVTYAPVATDDRLVHLGASLAYRDTGDSNEVRFRTTPETSVAGERLVDTRPLSDVADIRAQGVEAAVSFTPLTLQGEYIRTEVNREADLSSPAFDGWYVAGGWMITGESRPYDGDRGRFRGIKPRGPYGAWELAIRYSSLDLDDRGIAGGKQQDMTVGLNWYPRRDLRLMANYVYVSAAPNKNGEDESPSLLQVRAQLDF
jgi:phosphate-selective porin OprO/OprP